MMSLKKPAQVWGALGRAGQGGSPEHCSVSAFTCWGCSKTPLQGSLSHTAGAVQADKIPLCTWLRYLHRLFWTSLIFLFLPIISPENFYLQRLFSEQIPREPETDISRKTVPTDAKRRMAKNFLLMKYFLVRILLLKILHFHIHKNTPVEDFWENSHFYRTQNSLFVSEFNSHSNPNSWDEKALAFLGYSSYFFALYAWQDENKSLYERLRMLWICAIHGYRGLSGERYSSLGLPGQPGTELLSL